ncbi:MAG: hypothetical protein IIC22_09460, partial [Chloroflexi bacterium]|nr:hypothetical protein [Chloroflexota bacterium]
SRVTGHPPQSTAINTLTIGCQTSTYARLLANARNKNVGGVKLPPTQGRLKVIGLHEVRHPPDSGLLVYGAHGHIFIVSTNHYPLHLVEV